MKTAALAALLMLLGYVAFGRQEPLDLSTPEAAASTFLSEFVKGDLKHAAECVVGALPQAKITPYSDEMLASTRISRPALSFTHIAEDIHGDTATVTVRGALLTNLNNPKNVKKPFDDQLQLRRDGKDWKIVPPRDFAFKTASDKVFPSLAAFTVTSLPALDLARQKLIPAVCLSNVKQQCLGALMYAQDYDERFVYSAANYKTLVMPYIKSQQAFHCPSDKESGVSYSFNRRLAGKTVSEVSKPALTVLIYEGKNQKPVFRHGGRAVIGFADGHTKLIEESAAKTLLWNP